MLIRTEQTPNPATRKFLPDQPVMEGGTRDFPDAESYGLRYCRNCAFQYGQ